MCAMCFFLNLTLSFYHIKNYRLLSFTIIYYKKLFFFFPVGNSNNPGYFFLVIIIQ